MPPSTVQLDELLSHADWMKRLARGLVRDDAAAEDVVQDAYTAALHKPPPEGVSLRAWLSGVVRNVARQRWRSETRRSSREQRVAKKREDLPSTDELAARVELQRLIAEVVLALDEPYRSTVVLRYFEGHSSTEIARRAKVPASTVRWRLKRGLDLIRGRLDGAHDGKRGAWTAVLIPLAGPTLTGASLASTIGVAAAMKAKTTLGLAAIALLIVGCIALATLSLSGEATPGEPAQVDGAGPSVDVADTVRTHPSTGPSLSAAGDAAPSDVLTKRQPVADAVGRTVAATDSDLSVPRWPEPPPAAASTMEIRVVDPDGRPVPQLELTVLTGMPGRGSSKRYTVNAGIHALDTSSWGPTTEIWALKPCDEQGEPLPLAPFVVKGVQRGKSELLIQLSRGWRLSGQVLDSEDRPAPDVRVSVRRPGVRGQVAIAGSVRSDEAGRFVIEALPSEKLEVISYQQDSRWPDPDPLPLDGEEVSITLRLPAPLAFRVHVLSTEGKPVVGVTAHVSWVREGAYRYRRGPTGADGVATLWGVHPRLPLAVHVLPTPSHPSVPEFKRVGVPFGEGAVRVVLGGGAVIRGRVVDAQGQPVVAGEVVAEGTTPETAAFTATASPDGLTGEFTLRVKPGTYRVWLRESPGFPESRPVHMEAPAEAMRLVVAPSVEASGVLEVEEPQRWSLQWLTEPRSLPIAIGPAGKFRIVGIRDDQASLLATRTGDARVALLEGVRPSDGALVVRPVRGQSVSGSIQGLVDTRDTFVRISRGLVRLHAKVNADMTFSVDNVPPGSWRAELLRQHALLSVSREVAAGTTELVLVVE